MLILQNKTSRYILIVSIILMGISPAPAQKVGLYPCIWQGEIASLDDRALVDQMQIHQKTQFLYLISNDEKNLFIHLLINDRAAIQKTMRFGLTTWLNPDGKTKKSMGIQFPVAPDGRGDPGFRKDKGGDRKDMMMAMLAQKNREMLLIGFGAKGEQRRIDPKTDPAFAGEIKLFEDGGSLLVKLVVPLDKLGRGTLAGFDPPISLGFETGYLDVTGQGSPSGGGMQDGGGMHGGGGRSGGGMPGGGPPPGMTSNDVQTSGEKQKQPDINQLASPSKMWIKEVKLAPKP